MVSAAFAALAALGVAFTVVELFPFLGQQSVVPPSTSMTIEVSTLDRAAVVQLFFPFYALILFAVTVVLVTTIAFMFIHLHHAAAAEVGARLSELVHFTLCAAAGTLLFLLFVLPAGVVDDNAGALARALGGAAVDALPASATVVFFLGITLLIVHIRAGGEGGGGENNDVAGNRRVRAPVEDVLKRVALGAAAALLCQIAAALCLK